MFALPDGRALKLYRPSCRSDVARREVEAMVRAHAAGLRVPWPAEVCGHDGRPGLAMPMIQGQNGMDRLLADLSRLDEDARELATVHRSIHACSGGGLPDRKRLLAHRIQVAPGLDDPEKRRVLAMLSDLPSGGAMLHGDFHPGNLLWTEDGPWIIDWVDASRGVPEADVARSMVLFGHGDPELESDRQRYGAVYLESTGIQRDMERWLLATAAARLAEPASRSQPYLLDWVRKEATRQLG